MADTFICPEHGHYDASYGTCPHCSSRPLKPQANLDEDDMLTDPGGGGGGYQSSGYSDDDLPTQYGDEPGGYDDSEPPTEIPSGRNIFDADDEEITELGRDRRSADVTEIDDAVMPLGLLGILWVKEGGRRGHMHKIKDGTTVGRDDGDVYLEDPKVSNPHAKFTIEDDQFIVWDFGSKNGTYVNGDRIMAATPLEENDEIKMGDQIFVLKVLETGKKRKTTRRTTRKTTKSTRKSTRKK
jgi:hypothetical protein